MGFDSVAVCAGKLESRWVPMNHCGGDVESVCAWAEVFGDESVDVVDFQCSVVVELADSAFASEHEPDISLILGIDGESLSGAWLL